jgi:serine/threonine protein kinase
MQYLPSLAGDTGSMERWLSKAEQNAAFQHPGGVRVLDWGVDGEEAYWVSESVSGVDLRAVLTAVRSSGKRLGIPAAIYLVREILEVLAVAHEQVPPLVHLDLDPHSVLLRDDGRVVLTHFGTWDTLSPAEAARRRFDRGRVHYLAPELARSLPGDARSDVFSVGAILFELLAGERPFKAATQLLVAIAVAEGRRKSLHGLGLGLPDGLADVVESMLAVPLDERFQNARAALNALNCVAGELQGAREECLDWIQEIKPPQTMQFRPRTKAGAAAMISNGTAEFDVAAYLERAKAEVWPSPGNLAVPAPEAPASLLPPPLVEFSMPPADSWLRAPEQDPFPTGSYRTPLPHLNPELLPSASPGSAADDAFLAPPPLFSLAGSAAPAFLPPPSANRFLSDAGGAEAPPDFAAPRASLLAKDGGTSIFRRRTQGQLSAVSLPDSPHALAMPLAELPPLEALSTPLPLAEPAVDVAAPFLLPTAATPTDAWTDSEWREPSNTLFQMKSYAKQVTVRSGPRVPLWVVLLLSVLFGFVAVSGAFFVFRLLS